MAGDGKSAGVALFSAVSLAAMVIIPALVFASVLHLVFTNSIYYTGVLKGSYLLNAFVEGRNAAADRSARGEIDRDVRLDEYEIAAARWKEKYTRAREAFERANRNAEYEALERKLAEVKAASWKDAKGRFPDEKSFEESRDAETAKLGEKMRGIETYRENNAEVIGRAEKEFEIAKEKLEEAHEELEEKTGEAASIIERHRDTFAARLTADLERLGPRLTPLLNEKLIDGAVKREIEKQLEFICTYERQVETGAVRVAGGEGPMVRVPPVMITLWVDEAGGGRRHLLSQVFVEEIRKAPVLENRALLLSMFRMSDNVLGEYLANRYLKKAGVSINDGIIRLQPPVLEGAPAVVFQGVMMGASYGVYLKYAAGGFFVLYIVFLILVPVSRRMKLSWLGRICLYPSVLIILGSIALMIASGIIFDISPYLVPDAMLIGFAKNIARAAAFYLAVPIVIIFLPLFLAGLALGKAAKSMKES
jgi:hypothetical protein